MESAAEAAGFKSPFIEHQLNVVTDVPEKILQSTNNMMSGTASWTWYESYPFCCPDCGNYDPNAPTTECDDFSGCSYCGDFSDGTHETLEWV